MRITARHCIPFLCLFLLTPSRSLAQLLPDLTAEISNLQADFYTSVSPGDVAEGCATATTGRDLLRFSVTTRNIGPVDLTDRKSTRLNSSHRT